MNDPISDERLAELLDGKLPPEERAELLTRLAASREEFALFAELGGVLREAEEAESGVREPPVRAGQPVRVDEPVAADAPVRVDPPVAADPPVRPDAHAREAAAPSIRVEPPSVRQPSRWRRPSRWLPVAAVLALAALTPLLWSRFRGESDRLGAPVAVLAARDEGLPAGWMDTRPWAVTRSGSDPMVTGARAARLGALHTDLALAIAAGDTAAIGLLGERNARLLDEERGSGFAAAAYRAIAERRGEPPATLRESLDYAGNTAAEILGEEMVELGAWTEAARIAAARQDAAFFRSSATRRVLGRAADDERLSAEARQAAQALRAAEPTDWPTLTRHADALMHAIGS